MSCLGCSTNIENGKPGGCRSNGGCGSGGCNRMNTHDWLSVMELPDLEPFGMVEVSFKNGSRKVFYKVSEQNPVETGDMVLVESASGYDVGKISLSGELVRLQMKKKGVDIEEVAHQVIRKANQRDLEKLQEAREYERETMIRARAIARTIGLNMKLGDVEYQGDMKKATFYYTADGRVDFRELIRHYAKEFKVKIEMRQIGARQESARIGGIGSCGRELCCSTWLTDFKSVSTSAARYQNLAINQAKLSGQCGRLKCCLNYELDTYLDALESFPDKAERLNTQAGYAHLVKTDIFKGLMFYVYDKEGMRGKFYPLTLDRVKSILELNRRGEKPDELLDKSVAIESEEQESDYGDVTGFIELPPEERKKKKKHKKSRRFPRSKD
jgi:cell fate regulator YaaT (PSP1 superfamily)